MIMPYFKALFKWPFRAKFAEDGEPSGSCCSCQCDAQLAGCNHTGLGQYIPHEKQLMKCLMEGYDPSVRPAASPGDNITVYLHMVITNIRTLVSSTSCGGGLGGVGGCVS